MIVEKLGVILISPARSESQDAGSSVERGKRVHARSVGLSRSRIVLLPPRPRSGKKIIATLSAFPAFLDY